MTREDQIKKAAEIIAYGCSDELEAALIQDFPELKESEDERIMKEIIDFLDYAGDNHFMRTEDYENEIGWRRWLKKQKEQNPAEWSEEDGRTINDVIQFIEDGALTREDKDYYIERLKSLRPQPHTISIENVTVFGNLEYERGVKDGIQSEKSRHWKPSEEQMEALSDAYVEASTFKKGDILESLYNDLKSL